MINTNLLKGEKQLGEHSKVSKGNTSLQQKTPEHSPWAPYFLKELPTCPYSEHKFSVLNGWRHFSEKRETYEKTISESMESNFLAFTLPISFSEAMPVGSAGHTGGSSLLFSVMTLSLSTSNVTVKWNF